VRAEGEGVFPVRGADVDAVAVGGEIEDGCCGAGLVESDEARALAMTAGDEKRNGHAEVGSRCGAGEGLRVRAVGHEPDVHGTLRRECEGGVKAAGRIGRLRGGEVLVAIAGWKA